ncbi:MAG: membrane protein insertase YidC [Saprospiraceae bacterium]|nr:membrane protein insertase YidC [Saprospiraceae bacterium]
MDRNTSIGLLLIFGLFLLWIKFGSPKEDSTKIKKVEETSSIDSTKKKNEVVNQDSSITQNPQDTNAVLAKFGSFADATKGTEQEYVIENQNFIVKLTNKGGKIKSIQLKDYQKVIDSIKQDKKVPLVLLNDEKNIFSYNLPLTNGSVVASDALFFQPKNITKNSIEFEVHASDGTSFLQSYTIGDQGYNIDYHIKSTGLDAKKKTLLTWIDYLDKLEINHSYERTYSTVYYKIAEEDPEYCDCRKSDKDDIGQPIQWVSHSNQFFNTSIIPAKPFEKGVFETEMLPDGNDDLKKVSSEVNIPSSNINEGLALKIYAGPNKFDNLKHYGVYLEDIIPFGSGILGTLNRWVMRPIFDFLSSFISSKGLVIILLTLLVKLVLYPLTYKMLYSQSKMAALKPEIDKLKAKFGDDQQKVQAETMSLYREFGVNPLGGCLPMVIQMPIWFALYRFFPASITFRQEPFLWANDLSSYDSILNLGFNIPFYGSHVSLFTILWGVSTLIYTYYSTKQMDFSMQPAMKYMQYFMPIMFIFPFNTFASGLSCYLFFSNILNIGQTLLTKNLIINQDKIKAEMDEYRKKPKKKSSFMSKMENAIKEQQKLSEQRNKNKK